MAAGISLDDSYDDFPRIEETFGERLDESLAPRGPDSLWAEFDRLHPPEGGLVVDVGCGEGDASIELARRHPVRVHGVDPIERHIELASAAARAAAVDERVDFSVGVAEATGLPDSSASMIWTKEALMYADLDAAFAEFRRVLRPGGAVFAYQVCTGSAMSDKEAKAFWHEAAGARSVRPEHLHDAAAGAGLTTLFRTEFGSEWGEYQQERSGAGGRRLVHAARLLRQPSRYIEEFGEENYRIMLNDCLWHVHRMTGRLTGVAFGFRLDAP